MKELLQLLPTKICISVKAETTFTNDFKKDLSFLTEATSIKFVNIDVIFDQCHITYQLLTISNIYKLLFLMSLNLNVDIIVSSPNISKSMPNYDKYDAIIAFHPYGIITNSKVFRKCKEYMLDYPRIPLIEKQFRAGIVAGTFDHLHIGHKMLLTTIAISCSDSILIGITDDSMLKHKSQFECIQPLSVRKTYITKFLNKIGCEAKVEFSLLKDPVGPAGTTIAHECLIISEETILGGIVVNETRMKNKLQPIKLIISPLIGNIDTKLSSTLIRKEIDCDELLYLHTKWISLSKYLQINDELSNKWFDKIAKKYSEPWRAYHRLSHIRQMLIQLDQMTPQLAEYQDSILRIAVWFHDIVYFPWKTNNEEESSLIAIKFIKQIGKESLTNDLACLIMCTQNHISVGVLSAYLIDLDLSILGSNEEEYKSYVHGIWIEYSLSLIHI